MKVTKAQKLTEADTLQDVANDFPDLDRPALKDLLGSAKKIADELHAEIESVSDEEMEKGDIEKSLTKILNKALKIEKKRDLLKAEAEELAEKGDEAQATRIADQASDLISHANLLVVGPAGTGKTARIKQWATRNNINLVSVDAKTLDPSDLGGMIARKLMDDGSASNYVTKLGNTEFDVLDTPHSVLFLDELNRAPQDVTGSLLTLIQEHRIPDPESKSKTKILGGMLFTVASINPPDEGNNVDTLDDATLNRFKQLHVDNNPQTLLRYLKKKYREELLNLEKFYEQGKYDEEEFREERLAILGRYAIAKQLLSSSNFHFEDVSSKSSTRPLGSQTPFLSSRSLDNCLDNCDGTADDFLDEYEGFCGAPTYSMVEGILGDFEDVDDKANAVLDDEIEDPLAGNQDIYSKLMDKLFDGDVPAEYL